MTALNRLSTSNCAAIDPAISGGRIAQAGTQDSERISWIQVPSNSASTPNRTSAQASEVYVPVVDDRLLDESSIEARLLASETECRKIRLLNWNLKEQNQGLLSELDLRDQKLKIVLERRRLDKETYSSMIDQTKTERDYAESQIKMLNRSLEDCKEKIFKMQPMAHLTDRQIADQYHGLCASIADWAEVSFGDIENLLAISRHANLDSTQREMLHSYLYVHGEISVVNFYPEAGDVMIRYFIFRHLYETILREGRFFPSLSAEYESFVDCIGHEMTLLSPPRGNSKFRDLVS